MADESLDEILMPVVDQAILATRNSDPPAAGRSNRMVYNFATRLFGSYTAREYNAADLEPYLRRWYEACSDCVQTPKGLHLSYASCLIYFCDIWDNRRIAVGDGNHLALAIEQARNYELPAVADEVPEIRYAATVMYLLSRLSQDGVFFITQAQAGCLVLGGEACDAYTRGQGKCLLDYLQAKGYITLVAPGKPKRAARYCWGLPIPAPAGSNAAAQGTPEAKTGSPSPADAPAHDEAAAARQRFIEQWTQANGRAPTTEDLATWCSPPSEWREDD